MPEPDAVALLQLILRQPRLAQEAFQRLRRRTGARPLIFLAHRRRLQRQSPRDQRQPARRHEAVDGGGLKAGLGEFLGKQPRKVVGRLHLHARRNLLAAQFKEEVSHAIRFRSC